MIVLVDVIDGRTSRICVTTTTMSNPHMTTSYLDRLPLELVKLIFDNIGDSLIAHFTLVNLDRTFGITAIEDADKSSGSLYFERAG